MGTDISPLRLVLAPIGISEEMTGVTEQDATGDACEEALIVANEPTAIAAATPAVTHARFFAGIGSLLKRGIVVNGVTTASITFSSQS